MLKRIALAACSVLLAGNLFAAENPRVLLTTSLGEIELELEAEKAPISVENFIAYVDSGFYDGTVFHRVIPGFMIQGGGFGEGLNQKPTKAPIKNEADNGLHNVRGTVAMARTQNVNSATSQFFINHRDNDFLDPGSRGGRRPDRPGPYRQPRHDAERATDSGEDYHREEALIPEGPVHRPFAFTAARTPLPPSCETLNRQESAI